jgi:hypothetical protein
VCASWLLLSQCFSRTIICGRFSWPGSDDGAIYDAASWSLGKPQGVLIARTFNWMTRLIKDNARHYGFCRDSDACPTGRVDGGTPYPNLKVSPFRSRLAALGRLMEVSFPRCWRC